MTRFLSSLLPLVCAGLLLVSCSGGKPEEVPFVAPTRLSETGLYSEISTRTLAPGVLPFTPRFESWSDGARKERWLLLPEGQQIDTSDMDNWVFPIGTRSWKQFERDGRVVETRLLWKLKDGADGWFEMAFVWNEEGSDALASPDGQPDANGTLHDVPAQKACGSCHDGVRDVLLGPSAVQLSRSGGNGPLTEWARAGRLSHPPEGEFEVPGNETVQAALGYLHSNCGGCHLDGNALAVKRTLRLDLKTTDRAPEQTGAYRTTFNVKAFHVYQGSSMLIVPGEPEASQLLLRADVRGERFRIDDQSGHRTCRDLPR